MTDSMNILKASMLTPKVIADQANNAEEILETLIRARDYTPEKLRVFMNRSDVTGFFAHQLLRKCFDHQRILFDPILYLYIKKFIQTGTKEECLQYAIMTLQLWIHFIPSCDSLKSKDVEHLYPPMKAVISGLIKYWPEFNKSAENLCSNIEQQFRQGYYSEKSTFPGDTEPPFCFSHDNHVQKELHWYVFPFIGSVMISLAYQGTHYTKSDDLFTLATRKYFGNKEFICQMYIKSIEGTFTLDDIKQFIFKPTDQMEKFLLSLPYGEAAKKRFHELCKSAPAGVLFEALHCISEYAGFKFSNNDEYQNMTLAEKADFIKPYSSRLETNDQSQQEALLRTWINDPEWMNPERTLSELTLLVLRNRHMFSHNSEWLFSEMIVVILMRKYAVEFEEAKVVHAQYLAKMASGEFRTVDIKFIEESIDPGFILSAFEVTYHRYKSLQQEKNNSDWNTQYIYASVKNRIMKHLLFEHITDCLQKYNADEAYEVVTLAEAVHNAKAMEVLFTKNLSLVQSFELFKACNKTDESSISHLSGKMVDWLSTIESDEDALVASIYLVAVRCPVPNTILSSVFKRKSFSDLSALLKAVNDILGNKVIVVEGLGKTGIYDDVTELIRSGIVNHIEQNHDTRANALLLCHLPIFHHNFKNWYWLYERYPIEKLDDIYTAQLEQEQIASIFHRGLMREKLLSLWKSTPFEECRIEFFELVISKMEGYIHLDHHPEWPKISLQARLDLFKLCSKSNHSNMIYSLEKDFARLWKEGNWTVEKYLQEIEEIDPYEKDKFAKLAVDALNSK